MDGVELLFAAIVAVAMIGFILVIRGPVQRRLFAGTGLEEWRAHARQLPWRDRLAVERANSRGRAASPRLAPLAVERGQVIARMLDRAQARSHLLRFAYRALAVIGALLVILNAVLILIGDGGWSTWANMVIWAALTPLYIWWPRLQRRQLRLAQRSVDQNASLLSR